MMRNHLCHEKGIKFNIYESFKTKFKELVKTNSLLIVHTNLYFIEATNYIIIPLGNWINFENICSQCSCDCKWDCGTRIMPGLVYTKFIAIDKTDSVDKAFETFETKRLASKLTLQPDSRPLYDFPFQTKKDLELKCHSA